jgi:MinD superfamily P-loop ATPase
MINSPNIKIAIASGKGGTGKTLISTNMFHTFQESGYKVNLTDCDAEEPNDLIFFPENSHETFDVTQKVPVIDENKCTYCAKCKEYCNYNAILILPSFNVIQVFEDLCHGCGACSVACGDRAITEKEVSLGKVRKFNIYQNGTLVEARMNVGVYSPVASIKKAVELSDNEGIIIFDSPPGTSCPFIQTVATAHYVILITEPTPFGLSDLKQSIETLKTLGKPFGVIINRAGLGDNSLYKFLAEEKIELLMEIPFDKSVALHYSKGEIVAKYKPEWKTRFITILESIINKYGNSDNKR